MIHEGEGTERKQSAVRVSQIESSCYQTHSQEMKARSSLKYAHNGLKDWGKEARTMENQTGTKSDPRIAFLDTYMYFLIRVMKSVRRRRLEVEKSKIIS